MSEVASKGNRGFYSSFQYVTLIGGQLLALLVLAVLQAVLTVDDLKAWGWRIPFVIGALAAIVAMYLRRSLAETASGEAMHNGGRARSLGWCDITQARCCSCSGAAGASGCLGYLPGPGFDLKPNPHITAARRRHHHQDHDRRARDGAGGNAAGAGPAAPSQGGCRCWHCAY
jgi:MFS family permease